MQNANGEADLKMRSVRSLKEKRGNGPANRHNNSEETKFNREMKKDSLIPNWQILYAKKVGSGERLRFVPIATLFREEGVIYKGLWRHSESNKALGKPETHISSNSYNHPLC